MLIVDRECTTYKVCDNPKYSFWLYLNLISESIQGSATFLLSSLPQAAAKKKLENWSKKIFYPILFPTLQETKPSLLLWTTPIDPYQKDGVIYDPNKLLAAVLRSSSTSKR